MKLRARYTVPDGVTFTPDLALSMQPEGIPVKLFPDTQEEKVVGKARVLLVTEDVVEFELEVDESVVELIDADAGRYAVGAS